MERSAVRRVALVGHSGVGKTTVARFLRDEHGFELCNTGALCREVTRLIFGGEDKADLIRVSDGLQTIDPEIFLKASLRRIDLSKPVVLDSLRFEHDLAFARRENFFVLRVTAQLDRRRAWASAQGANVDFETLDGHRSERELESAPVDAQLENASDTLALRSAVARLLRLE